MAMTDGRTKEEEEKFYRPTNDLIMYTKNVEKVSDDRQEFLIAATNNPEI